MDLQVVHLESFALPFEFGSLNSNMNRIFEYLAKNDPISSIKNNAMAIIREVPGFAIF